MELFVENGKSETFLFDLIVSYLKLSERNKVKTIYLSDGSLKAIKTAKLSLQVPSLVTLDGDILTDTYQISSKLFEILPQWQSFFLGSPDQAQAKEVEQIKTHLKEGKQLRKYLQKHLQSRTFFVGNHITYADLFMFTHLYDNVLEMTDEQKLQYNNLFRWYKHIQNLPQIKEYLAINKRFLVQDPTPKHAFIAEKKKPKKQKEEKKEQKKVQTKIQTKDLPIAEVPKAKSEPLVQQKKVESELSPSTA